jgi:REP element-mobilizing transposase RayT
MARLNRQTVSAEMGGYHIISRVAGGDFLFKPEDKEYFLNLLRRFVAGYFVQLHSFAIMSNHFHLLVTIDDKAAENTNAEELAARLWTVNTGEFKSHKDTEQKTRQKQLMLHETGSERAKERLSSISRFTQDLKQYFARYFNQKHQRLGCLWGNRFKGVIISHGNAQLACSAYIDLNPVRAGITKRPEDYRWCSLGLIEKEPDIAKYLLTPVQLAVPETRPWQWYKAFVHQTGDIKPTQTPQQTTKKANQTSPSIQRAQDKCQHLQLSGKLKERIRNLSEGIVAGTASLITTIQEKLQRQPRNPREPWEGCPFFTTRVFHQPQSSI